MDFVADLVLFSPRGHSAKQQVPFMLRDPRKHDHRPLHEWIVHRQTCNNFHPFAFELVELFDIARKMFLEKKRNDYRNFYVSAAHRSSWNLRTETNKQICFQKHILAKVIRCDKNSAAATTKGIYFVLKQWYCRAYTLELDTGTGASFEPSLLTADTQFGSYSNRTYRGRRTRQQYSL